jgi:hypothetical protein
MTSFSFYVERYLVTLLIALSYCENVPSSTVTNIAPTYVSLCQDLTLILKLLCRFRFSFNFLLEFHFTLNLLSRFQVRSCFLRQFLALSLVCVCLSRVSKFVSRLNSNPKTPWSVSFFFQLSPGISFHDEPIEFPS